MTYVMVGALVGLVTLLLTNLLSVHPRSEEIKRLQAEKDALKIDLSRSLMFCQLLKSMNELDDETLDKRRRKSISCVSKMRHSIKRSRSSWIIRRKRSNGTH